MVFLRFGGKTESGLDLFAQQIVEPFDVYSCVIGNRVVVYGRLSVEPRKKNGTAELYDFI